MSTASSHTSNCADFFLLPPLCFHLSRDVSLSAERAKSLGSLEHLALMEKGFCRGRELTLGLEGGEVQPQFDSRNPCSILYH